MTERDADWLIVRERVRQYVRNVLYVDLPLGVQAQELKLPRRDAGVVTDEDVYASRAGGDDPAIDEHGTVLRRGTGSGTVTIVRGSGERDPTGAQARVASGWRRYLERELEGQTVLLRLSRDTVRFHVEHLDPDHWRAIYDLGHTPLKAAAAARRITPDTLRRATNAALDALLDRLYAASVLPRAS